MPSREEMQQEALGRAAYGQSGMNYGAIFAGFTAKGIPEADIRPRENVLTYHAWRALGRQVRRGEHGVKVITFVSIDRDGKAPTSEPTQSDATANKRRGSRPWSATVFHASQTDPIK
jgi:antirestriction protein ArdC